jgi:hypothetical protein
VPAPFFIVGNDRSGTTMLRLILDAGPDVAIPPESMYLTDFAPVRAKGGPADALAAQELTRQAWEHPKVALWELPGGAPAVPLAGDPETWFRFAMEAPFAAYARMYGKPGWADKTPHYVHHVDFLLSVWPDAKVVVLVRDGRDVALSLKRLPFGPNNAWAAAQWWARGVRAGRKAVERHPDRVRCVRYEDIVADPEGEVRSLCGFLGLRFEPGMLDLRRVDRSRIVPDQVSWFPTIFEGIGSDAVERWRREMSPRDQRTFAALAGDELAAHGYEPGPAEPVSDRRATWLHRHNQLIRNVNFIRLRVFQERGRELRFALVRRIRDPYRGSR